MHGMEEIAALYDVNIISAEVSSQLLDAILT